MLNTGPVLVAEASALTPLGRRGFLLENQNGAGLADDAEDALEALPPACALTRAYQGLNGGFDRRLC